MTTLTDNKPYALGDLVAFVEDMARLNGIDPMSVPIVGLENYSLFLGGGGLVLKLGPTEEDRRAMCANRNRLAAEAKEAIDRLRDAR